MLIRITSPYFVAGMIVNKDGQIEKCAPILRKFFQHEQWEDVLMRLAKKQNWKVEEVMPCDR